MRRPPLVSHDDVGMTGFVLTAALLLCVAMAVASMVVR